jgi:hypothetical protein
MIVWYFNLYLGSILHTAGILPKKTVTDSEQTRRERQKTCPEQCISLVLTLKGFDLTYAAVAVKICSLDALFVSNMSPIEKSAVKPPI